MMSKKQQKTRKQKITMPLLALIGGLLLIVAGVLFALQGRGNQNGSGTPDIAVSQEQIDYGEVKLDTPLTFQIEVANTGDGTLRIEKEPYLEVLEGC
jgi:hypothetical protein